MASRTYRFSEYDPVPRTADVWCRRARQADLRRAVDDQRRAVREVAEGRRKNVDVPVRERRLSDDERPSDRRHAGGFGSENPRTLLDHRRRSAVRTGRKRTLPGQVR